MIFSFQYSREVRLRMRIDELAARIEQLERERDEALAVVSHWWSSAGGLKNSREYWKTRALAAEKKLAGPEEPAEASQARSTAQTQPRTQTEGGDA